MTKSLSSCMSFCPSSSFSANAMIVVLLLSCSTFPHPVLPFPSALLSIPCTSRFVPHYPSQNPVQHACYRSLLQRTQFLSHSSTLSSYVLPFLPVLPTLVPHFQNPVEHARSRSLLQGTFFPIHFHPVLPYIVDFTSIVFVMCFSSYFGLLEFS